MVVDGVILTCCFLCCDAILVETAKRDGCPVTSVMIPWSGS